MADLLRACGLDSEVGGPERGISEGVGSGDRDLEAEWPISDAMSEAIFKAFARALRFAATRDPQLKRVLPSTKGLL